MNCPTCGSKMVEMLFSSVCDVCAPKPSSGGFLVPATLAPDPAPIAAPEGTCGDCKCDPKTQALARFLEVDHEEISAAWNDENFSYGRQDFLVLTDSEADSMARETILDQVWAFRPEFLEAHMDLDQESIETLQEKSDSANKALLRLIRDKDHFVHDAISSDGRGHFLSGYDGEEHEERVDGETFFIYRTN